MVGRSEHPHSTSWTPWVGLGARPAARTSRALSFRSGTVPLRREAKHRRLNHPADRHHLRRSSPETACSASMAREAGRLRPGQTASGRRPDSAGGRCRNHRLHGSGTAAGRTGQRAVGPVRARRRGVRAGGRTAHVHGPGRRLPRRTGASRIAGTARASAARSSRQLHRCCSPRNCCATGSSVRECSGIRCLPPGGTIT